MERNNDINKFGSINRIKIIKVIIEYLIIFIFMLILGLVLSII